MARVTVEDCVTKIPNRFKLVMLAAQRSRELSVGAELSVERDNDKNPVVALREIADETVSLEGLESTLIKGLQRHVEAEEPLPDDDDDNVGVVAETVAEATGAGEDGDENIAAGDDATSALGAAGGFEDDPSAVTEGKMIGS